MGRPEVTSGTGRESSPTGTLVTEWSVTRRSHMRQSIALPLVLLVIGACGGPTEPEGPPPLLTELPRALSAAELRIVDGANTFAFDLLREATRELPPDSNAFLSPLSASMALGMTLNGAERTDLRRHAERPPALRPDRGGDKLGLSGPDRAPGEPGLADGDADRQLPVGPRWTSAGGGLRHHRTHVLRCRGHHPRLRQSGRRADHQHLGERQDERQDPPPARRASRKTRCSS